MKLLVAVISCDYYETSGLNKPIRETWLPDAVKAGMDYKFFHGTVEKAPDKATRRPLRTPKTAPESDIVVLKVPDDYGNIALKTREAHRWAYNRGYDFVFQCFPDTYVCVERLLRCGFENADYLGSFWPGYFAVGGQGHWLSRKAISYIMDATVDWRVGPWHKNWCAENQGAEDVWIGMTLKDKTDIIKVHSRDMIYEGRKVDGPLMGNTVISSHLSDSEVDVHGGYKPEYMYEKHQAYLNSFKG
jgi:hypothetical protein